MFACSDGGITNEIRHGGPAMAHNTIRGAAQMIAATTPIVTNPD